MSEIHFVKTFVQKSEDTSIKYLYELKEYDKNGNLICLKNYNENGDVIYENTFVFDEGGKLIKESLTDFKGSYNETKEYKYADNTDLLIEEKIDYGEAGYSVKKYFREDKKIIIKLLDEDGDIEEETEIILDDNGNTVSQTSKDDMGNITEKFKNNFDDNGKLILKEEFDNRGKLEKSHYYFYTSADKLQAIKTLNSREKIIDWVKIDFNDKELPVLQTSMSGDRIEIEYPAENIIIQKYINSSGVEVTNTQIIRDEKGNTLEEHSPEEIKTYEYIYY